MANSYFQFKKFRIEQGNTAMKVCTDSCIFGAYINTAESKFILDIGAGTGLLSLMVAQRSDALIDAIEIEEQAFIQAKENIHNSPWNNQIKIYHDSIQHFAATSNNQYDLIISNPPFFKNQLKSPNQNKNIAHHSDALSFEELAIAVTKLLNPQGSFFLLLPEIEFNSFTSIANTYDLYLSSILEVRDKQSGPIVRVIGSFSSEEKGGIVKEELIIKNESGQYTDHFISLLKDYYLHL